MKKPFFNSMLVLPVMLFLYCGKINPPKPKIFRSEFELSSIKLPDGFNIEIYADRVVNARSMALSPSGVLFVGTREKGDVYALVDSDGDYKAEKQYLIASKLNMPNGVALKNGDLYVAEVNRILRFKNIEANLEQPGQPEVIYDKFPTEKHHGWKYIAFGPDEKLYVPVGAPCNICESEDKIFNTITRMNPDGSNFEIVHSGVRNTVGFTWHPSTKELWFTDNGRDMMGDDMPSCELNRANKDFLHFGYPYCHQGNVPDPEFGNKFPCSQFVKPAQNLGAHVAPLGIEFYTGNNFPASYKNQVLLAEHGSWNRSKKSGYQLSLVTLDENFNAIRYQPFATGWLNTTNDDVSGRPVDLEMLPDGSMLVSDDYADVIYRIYYSK
jgi:glucose/arabinose dehydrogenase